MTPGPIRQNVAVPIGPFAETTSVRRVLGTMTTRWNDSLKIGLPQIDLQHQNLVELLDTLELELEKKNARVDILRALVQLANYIEEHFSDEEAYQASVEYPHMDEHRQQHAQFLQVVEELKVAYREGNTELGPAVIEFLLAWVTEHIARSDAKLGRFVEWLGSSRNSLPAEFHRGQT